MFLPMKTVNTAHDPSSSAPTWPSGPPPSTRLHTPLRLPLPSPNRSTGGANLGDNPQAALGPHRRSRMLNPRSDYTHLHSRSHTIHRRAAPRHADQQQTTAVLAGVLGGFGVLCVAAWVIWVVRRRRRRTAREERRRARELKKVEAERRGTSEVARSGGGETKSASNPQSRPRFEDQNEGASRPSVEGKLSSASKKASVEHMRGPPATKNPSTVPSPLGREAQLPPGPHVHSKATPHSSPQASRVKLPQVNQSPRPRPQEFEVPRLPKEDSAGRPGTPTMPMHPPLAFSDSPPSNIVGRALDSNHVPSPNRYPRKHVGAAAPSDSALRVPQAEASDTEYFSDASTAATRQTLTNTGDRGGMANIPRANRSPRVQQTVVLDLPPAYTPDPS